MVSITYLALVSGVMIWRGISVSPDYLLLILVPVALLSGRAFAFLRDWVPFVALFLGYEALSGVAPKLGIRPQVGSMVHIERALFAGRDPHNQSTGAPSSEVLQRHLGGLHWLVIACTVTCFCHFLFPRYYRCVPHPARRLGRRSRRPARREPVPSTRAAGSITGPGAAQVMYPLATCPCSSSACPRTTPALTRPRLRRCGEASSSSAPAHDPRLPFLTRESCRRGRAAWSADSTPGPPTR